MPTIDSSFTNLEMMPTIEFDHLMGLNAVSNAAIFHPNGKNYLCSSGGNIIMGDLMDAHSQLFLREHDDIITCITVSSSGNLLASGQSGERPDILVWDLSNRNVIFRFEEHDSKIQDISFSQDERILASIGSSEDSKLMIWDLSNGCIIASASKLPLGTVFVSCEGGFIKDIKRRDTDHYMIFTGGQDGLTMWDLDPFSGDMVQMRITGDVRATINREITSIAFSDTKEFLFGATSSGDFIIANMRSHKIIQSINATKMSLNCILSYDENIIIGCGDNTIKVYGPSGDFKGQVVLDGPVMSLSFSPSKSEVLASTAVGTITRVNLATMKFIIISESHTKTITQVSFDEGNPDRFATTSLDGTIRVWDIAEYAVTCTVHARKEQVRGAFPQCLAFADILYSGWSDGKILAHSAETGENLWLLDNAHPSDGGVTALVLSHNRRFLLTGGQAGEVRLWELRSRELISHLKEHKQRITSLALFDDDSMALSACRDRNILRWDLKTERRVHCHMQRMGGLHGVVILKDQQHSVTVGQEKKIVMWDWKRNDPVFQSYINEENDEGNALAISHDGNWIATGGTAGMVRIWAVRSQPGQAPSLHLSAESLASVAHSKPITSLAFSLDDKQIISTGEDGSIFIWCMFIN